MDVSRFARLVALISVSFLVMAEVAGQVYPSKPIKVVMMFTPGGVSDGLVRAVTDKAAIALGQPFVIEHKPGAAGMLGASLVANGPADGYTLLFGSTGLSVNATLQRKLQYDLMKDLTPLTLVGSGPWALFVSEDIKATNVKELLAVAKSRPGVLNYGSVGIGSSPHLLGVMLSRAADLDITHVPYKGAGEIVAAMASGQVHMTFNSLGPTAQFEKVGRARLLAVTSAQRLPEAPDVPTMAESLPGFSREGWFGFFAPSGVPPAVISRLNAELTKAIASAEVSEKISRLGFSPRPQTLEEASRYIANDVEVWGKAVKASGATAD
ncbi:MAG: tripartite tricarboxylate transporter substrate binding protein [Burkholderiaceae bacterium]